MTRFLNLSEKEQSRPIYRILSIDRLFELFDKGRNVLANPGLWQDPYENFILRSKVRRKSGELIQYGLHKNIYGQCWSLHRASDAMWRLYSDGNGVRIKTTTDKLLSSLYHAGIHRPDRSCGAGKVRYLYQSQLMNVANSTYSDSSISSEKLFHSLLIKRRAFSHEREVRLFYLDIKEQENGKLFSYPLDPHGLIGQIMLDPRIPAEKSEDLKSHIRKRTGFRGDIKRSLLYEAPELILDAGHVGVHE